ncbi:AAA family ATPase [Candidatus Gottesmanbacteria bacterium]|nr:AAA family ATPase [Candidatus Gottesmanbacteria bacterium]
MKASKVFIVGIVGLPGSGKTTAAKYLESKGFTRVTLSDFIKEEVAKAGITDYTREILQDYGNKMREQFGPQVLAQLALKKLKTDGVAKAVIDGIRNIHEVAALEIENNFHLVGIVAKPSIRYHRLLMNKGKAWVGSFEEFLQQEKREDSLGSQKFGLRVTDCLQKAKYFMHNNASREDFQQSVDAMLKRL